MSMLSDPALITMLLLAIVLMPLLAAVLLVFFGRRMGRPDWLATASIGLGAVIALTLFWQVIVRQGDPEWRWATVVATCIFAFSQGYMHGDKNYSRFFAYLSYFCFAMLGLVVVDNLLVLFMFWELVGVGSYLSRIHI